MRGKQLAAIKLKPHSQKIWEILFSIGRKTGAVPAPPLALPLSLSLFLVTADPPAEFTVFSCCLRLDLVTGPILKSNLKRGGISG
jgi:hypothetical protein